MEQFNSSFLSVLVGALIGSSANAQISMNGFFQRTLSIQVFAGGEGGVGTADATGAAAQFNSPMGIAVDSSGSVYVADTYNNTIRKITAAGFVTTFAGTAGSAGSVDGTGAGARFNNPSSIAIDSSGTLYVADTNNQSIRKITASAVVTKIAGSTGTCGSTDGTGAAALFCYPSGITVDNVGNVYVSDTNNQIVRKITTSGVVTTIAGTAGMAGTTNGTGAAARFGNPNGITIDSSGNLYVLDSPNSTIRKITPSGIVTTFAGAAGSSGTTNGTGSGARFGYPKGIAIDNAGNLYVAETSNATIRKVTPAAVVTTLAGTAGSTGSTDGTGTAARFYGPNGLGVDSSGNVYITDTNNSMIRKMTAGGVVTTFAGSAGASSADGTGNVAGFNNPQGFTIDGSGNFYIADTSNSTIRKITAGGVVTTLAGTAGSSGSTNGTGAAARFNNPYDIAIDAANNLYVADTNNHVIRKITSAGVVSTFAGTPGSSGSTDGTGAAARFNHPYGLTIDAAGVLYVADTNNHTIRKITSGGIVTTLAGSAGSIGSVDGTGATARFSYPHGIEADGSGNLFLADTNNATIRKISSGGVVTTLAGAAGSYGNVDGTGAAARFNFPYSINVDSSGNLYVADTSNSTIRKITLTGVTTTLAGTAGKAAVLAGPLPSTLRYPGGISVVGGVLYFSQANGIFRFLLP